MSLVDPGAPGDVICAFVLIAWLFTVAEPPRTGGGAFDAAVVRLDGSDVGVDTWADAIGAALESAAIKIIKRRIAFLPSDVCPKRRTYGEVATEAFHPGLTDLRKKFD